MTSETLETTEYGVTLDDRTSESLSLRNCLFNAITKAQSHKHALDEFALQDCHEYHAALLAFEKKGFPSSDEVSNLELTWVASVPPQKEKHGSVVPSLLRSKTRTRRDARKPPNTIRMPLCV